MQPESRKLLWDVADSAHFIMVTASDVDLETYLANRSVRHIVERNMQIVGEALNQLRKVDALLAGSVDGLDAIVALRHRLVHGYRDIEDALIWEYQRYLVPKLFEQVNEMLRSAGFEFNFEVVN